MFILETNVSVGVVSVGVVSVGVVSVGVVSLFKRKYIFL